jgi:hypothetical protein
MVVVCSSLECFAKEYTGTSATLLVRDQLVSRDMTMSVPSLNIFQSFDQDIKVNSFR